MRDHYDRAPSREPREMFDAICDECGRKCKVPFKPTSNKPVFCSDCFERMQGSNQRRDGSFGDMNLQRQLDEINYKLGKILKMLEPKAPSVYNKLPPVKRKAQKAFDDIIAKMPEANELPEDSDGKTEETA